MNELLHDQAYPGFCDVTLLTYEEAGMPVSKWELNYVLGRRTDGLVVFG